MRYGSDPVSASLEEGAGHRSMTHMAGGVIGVPAGLPCVEW